MSDTAKTDVLACPPELLEAVTVQIPSTLVARCRAEVTALLANDEDEARTIARWIDQGQHPERKPEYERDLARHRQSCERHRALLDQLRADAPMVEAPRRTLLAMADCVLGVTLNDVHDARPDDDFLFGDIDELQRLLTAAQDALALRAEIGFGDLRPGWVGG